jgi:hypothetical protein
VFSLKENQETLYGDVKTCFGGIDFARPDPPAKAGGAFEVDHGRRERRNHAITDDVSRLVASHPAWNTMASIGVIESIRTLGASVRAHWGIERSLHYVRDAAFGGDACRIKSGRAPENPAFIRKIALSLARSDTQSRRSITSRIKRMAWSDEYLEHLSFQSEFAAQTKPVAADPYEFLMRSP